MAVRRSILFWYFTISLSHHCRRSRTPAWQVAVVGTTCTSTSSSKHQSGVSHICSLLKSQKLEPGAFAARSPPRLSSPNAKSFPWKEHETPTSLQSVWSYIHPETGGQVRAEICVPVWGSECIFLLPRYQLGTCFFAGTVGETLWNVQWIQEGKVIIFWRWLERQLDVASKRGLWRGRELSVVIVRP